MHFWCRLRREQKSAKRQKEQPVAVHWRSPESLSVFRLLKVARQAPTHMLLTIFNLIFLLSGTTAAAARCIESRWHFAKFIFMLNVDRAIALKATLCLRFKMQQSTNLKFSGFRKAERKFCDFFTK